jgi:hypothetical protein
MSTQKVPRADRFYRNVTIPNKSSTNKNIIKKPSVTPVPKNVINKEFAAQLVADSGTIIISAGETKEVWAEFKNIGIKSWDSNTKLGTNDPRDRLSVFANNWISCSRIVSVKNKVMPGETYRFNFTIKAPENFNGTFIENFRMVQEGVIWFEKQYGNVSFTITSIMQNHDNISIDNNIKEYVGNLPVQTTTNLKILYLSCHESLEYDDVSNLRALGFDVFVVGHNTYNNSDITIKKLAPNDIQLQEYFDSFFKIGFKPGLQIKLNAEFINKFDIIISSHYSENIIFNWEYMRSKICIYRSIASCNVAHEKFYSNYRKQGLKIVRLSPAENKIADSVGSDAIIRASIEPNYYKQWVGENLNILTIQKMINISPSRMHNEYEQVTDIFKDQRILCGKYNEMIPYAKNNVSENELVELRSNCRVYLALCSKPAPLVITFSEAMMAGMPIVTFGKKLIGYEWFEQPDFIENGINGFYGNTISEIQNYIRILLSDYEWSKSISIKARETAIKHFSPDIAREKWRIFFKEHCNIVTL